MNPTRNVPALSPFGHLRGLRTFIPTHITHDPSPSPTPTHSPGDSAERHVEVSVLVAMPSPRSKSAFDPNADAIADMVPEIAVGVAHLPYRASLGAVVSTSKLEGADD